MSKFVQPFWWNANLSKSVLSCQGPLAVRAIIAWVGALSHATCPPTIGTMTYSTLNWDNVLQNTQKPSSDRSFRLWSWHERPDRGILANRIWSVLKKSWVIDVSTEFQCLWGTKNCWNGHICALSGTHWQILHTSATSKRPNQCCMAIQQVVKQQYRRPYNCKPPPPCRLRAVTRS